MAKFDSIKINDYFKNS